MFQEVRHNTLLARSRRTKLSALTSALKHIGYYKRYDGASKSATIDFMSTYNRPDQRAIYGTRTREDVAKMSKSEYSQAQSDFNTACHFCEFRCVPGKCQGAAEENRVFELLCEDPAARRRFISRLENPEVENGYKSTLCFILLQKARLKKEDWLID